MRRSLVEIRVEGILTFPAIPEWKSDGCRVQNHRYKGAKDLFEELKVGKAMGCLVCS
jgi:hypothetical protein